MIPIQNFYTGTNAGYYVPDFSQTDKSLKDYYDKQFKMNYMLLEDAQRRQKEFLDYTNVTPVQTIFEQHKILQAAKIKELEDKVKPLMGRNLSTAEKMELRNKQNEVASFQQGLTMHEQAYLSDREKMRKEPWKYRQEDWEKAEKNFLVNPYWDSKVALVPTPANLTTKFDEIIRAAEIYSTDKDFVRDAEGNVIGEKMVKTPIGTKEERRAKIKQRALSDREMMDGMSAVFADLFKTEEGKKIAQRYLDESDANNDGLSIEERTNAVFNYAVDNYAQMKDLVAKGSRDIKQTNSDTQWTAKGLSDKSRTYVSPAVLNLNFLKGVEGLQPVRQNTKSFTIDSSNLQTIDGVEMPKEVEVEVKGIGNGKVEFSVKNKVREYKTEGGEKKLYTNGESEDLIVKTGLKREPAGKKMKSPYGEGEVNGYYMYSEPESVPAVGDLSDYLSDVSKGMSTVVIPEDKLLEFGGTKTEVRPVTTKPTVYIESDFSDTDKRKIKLFIEKNKTKYPYMDFDRAVRELIGLGILPKWEGK
jgi:hypothetical protein